MNRIFRQALEAYTPETTDEESKDFIVMKGPLSELYTEALNKVYAKPDAVTGVATESQANDALMMQALASDVNTQTEEGADSKTTVYGVSAAAPTQDDLLDISKEFEGDDKFVLIIDGTVPGPNSPEDAIPGERAEVLTGAMEAFVKALGGQVFHSLEEFAESRKKA